VYLDLLDLRACNAGVGTVRILSKIIFVTLRAAPAHLLPILALGSRSFGVHTVHFEQRQFSASNAPVKAAIVLDVSYSPSGFSVGQQKEYGLFMYRPLRNSRWRVYDIVRDIDLSLSTFIARLADEGLRDCPFAYPKL
jgi:hypothetical protein